MSIKYLLGKTVADLNHKSHPGEDIEISPDFGQRVYENMGRKREEEFNPYQLPLQRSPSQEQRITK